MTENFINLAEKTLIEVLKGMRPTLMSHFGKIEHELKKDHTVLTKLDKELEYKLRQTLKILDSSIGVEGEEYGIEGNRSTYWLVDPIDGTEQFIRGIPSFRTQMCLVEDGHVVWSLIYMFATDELWLSRKGKGAFCNGQKITMGYRPLSTAWIDISVDLTDQENVRILQNVRKHIAGYAIIRDTTPVIRGQVDGIINLIGRGGPWDYAPRGLMLEEAGAKILNIGSQTYDFNQRNFIVAHPDNFDLLMDLVIKK